MTPGTVRTATAFAPGHVTGLFQPIRSAPDPRRQGSIGAGLVLDLGVTATVTIRPDSRARLRFTSNRASPVTIASEAARHLLDKRRAEVHVHLARDLPIGQGFGTSASDATATSLALARLVDVPRSQGLVVAHLADLFGGGGLGGVAAILGGGLEVRRAPGLPPFGRVVHAPVSGAVLVGVVGRPIPSPHILASERWRRRFAGAAAGLRRLDGRPTLPAFFDAAERFTDQAGLASRRLRATLGALRRRGAWAFQAMFGSTFVARPRSPRDRPGLLDWLQRSGTRAVEIPLASRGARLLPEAPTAMTRRRRGGAGAESA